MENKLPTIKEIARRLNVSVSTVSRALNDNPRIGLRTRTAVQQLAKELNYEPNAKAIFFKQKRTYVIGVILPFIREDFFSAAISGIETAAMQHDYTILFGQSYDNMEQEVRVVEAMKKQRVDGIIISLSKETNSLQHLAALEKYSIPVVYFDRVPRYAPAHKVFCNLYNSTVEMVTWLVKQGHKRIAFVNGPDKIAASKERLNGYIEGLSRKKMKVDMQLVETTDLSRESTWQAMEKFFSQKHPPTAVISFNDYVHLDAVQYAQHHHIDINKTVAFVSYANIPMTSYSAYPPVVSIEQHPLQQGQRAIEMLINILSHKHDNTLQADHFFEEELMGELIHH
ncbi:MAG TPA: LacI family DNA-binding transcriptional regulator [Chitinophagaceae bacterium]|nr:LacI family DNA-binding transcriptional regulator [Chitinophagaceae bacterium]